MDIFGGIAMNFQNKQVIFLDAYLYSCYDNFQPWTKMLWWGKRPNFRNLWLEKDKDFFQKKNGEQELKFEN